MQSRFHLSISAGGRGVAHSVDPETDKMVDTDFINGFAKPG
jgi:hypothetical protein